MYNQQYLIDLINNKIEENLNLDYKAAGSLQRNDIKVKELSKDISAFANSAGGVIIYGMSEDPINRHLPNVIDPVDRNVISKEWLEQTIQGNIQPRLTNIVIHPIEINGDLSKVVYLVEVAKSSTAHQANDKKYYKRFNFNSEAMYDYEIKDILNRTKNPIISVEFKVKVVKHQDSEPCYKLIAYAKNEGSVLANYINVHVTIPQRCLATDYIPVKDSTETYLADNTTRDLIDVRMQGLTSTPIYGPSRYDPLLPRMQTRLDSAFPDLHQYYSDAEYTISWEAYADNAEPVTGIVNCSDIPVDHSR